MHSLSTAAAEQRDEYLFVDRQGARLAAVVRSNEFDVWLFKATKLLTSSTFVNVSPKR